MTETDTGAGSAMAGPTTATAATAGAAPAPPGGAGPLAWVSLFVVYLAWGSTYVAIRVGVRDIPPMTLAGVRYFTAGVLLWPVAVRSGGDALRRTDRPGLRQWAAGGLLGVLLLVFGNGVVTYAEKTVSAGMAALLVATVPLWMAVGGRVLYGVRVGRAASLGLLVGIAGVALLVQPGGGGSRTGMLLVLAAAASWGLGSVAAPHLPLPSRPLLSTAVQLLPGGAVLLAAGAAAGEFGHLRAWSGETIGAMVFLVLGGTLLGFTSYVYVLARLPAPVVSTYAYVNPLVAVALGWILLDERLTGWAAAGAALIVAAVAAVVASRSGGRSARRSR